MGVFGHPSQYGNKQSLIINMKYRIVEHNSLPLELRNIKSVVNSQHHKDETMIHKCQKLIGGGNNKLRTQGQRHHFYYDPKMNIIRCLEYINTWDMSFPSRYYITRKYKSSKPTPQNCYYVEESELYYCFDCEVYCWSNNSLIRPFEIWSQLYEVNYGTNRNNQIG